jgi:hypothetical protein
MSPFVRRGDINMQWPKGWRSEELIISSVKTLRFTVGIINKSLIIPTEDLTLTSFGPNDIDNIDEAAQIKFFCPKNQKDN